MYETLQTGSKYGSDFKVFITKDGVPISSWHDIPCKTEYDYVITVVNEIPRFENAKFEINKNEKYNPITQDTKHGKPRFVRNIFPYKGYIWNYGAVPQTWESPHVLDKSTNAKGDNDPIDVIEIGEKCRRIGEVYQAKVIGALAMLDGGECDWKLLVLGVDNQIAKMINTIRDVENYMPSLLEATVDWFKNYKAPDGKKVDFALDAQFQDADFAMKIIEEAHNQWKSLFTTIGNDVSLINTSLKESNFYEASPRYPEIEKKVDSLPPADIQGYFFVQKR